MRLRELLTETERGVPLDAETRGDADVEVSGVVHDTRAVSPGSLFCCVRGSRIDAHELAADALAAGAVALVVDHFLPLHATQVRVPAVRPAMGPLAASLHGHPSRSMRCLAVTGTNGKTTTTYLLESIERRHGARVGVVGTVGARADGVESPSGFTTPEAPDLQALLDTWRTAGVEAVAMEVSSHGLAQHRVDGTEFAAACFTNLSHDHLDFHGTMDAYFDAKARLFTRAFTANAAINTDDPWGRRLETRARDHGLVVSTYGLGADATVRAESVEMDAAGSTFTLVHEPLGLRERLRSPLLGTFNVANTLGAAATALAAGLPLDAVLAGLSDDLVVPGRLESVPNDRGLTVLVDYAHTPDALESALRAARDLAGERRVVVVFGCGGDRDREKRPVMGATAARGADHVVVTSDNPRSESPTAIADAILAGIVDRSHVEVELDRRRAIANAVEWARRGDVVLIAGKGHEKSQTTGEFTVPFDDRVVAAEELTRA